MARIKLGIIGCGVIGNSHLAATAELADDYELVAVADLHPDRARKAASKYTIPKTYGEGSELVDDDDVEAVILALPAFGRHYLALRAFGNGKHVLIEKPIAMNACQVEQFIAARGDLVAGCCSSRFRFAPSAGAVTAFLNSGALGDLRVVRCRALIAAAKAPDKEPPLWRESSSLNGGGILVNWGCYDLDYLLGILGWRLKPVTTLAQAWPVAPHLASRAAKGSDAEAHFVGLIRCESGEVITFERAEFAAAAQETAWEITGAKGSVRLTMTAAREKMIYHDDSDSEEGVSTKVLWEGEETGAPYRGALQHDFANAIRSGAQPKTSLENALVVQRITDAIYASASTGKAVDIG